MSKDEDAKIAASTLSDHQVAIERVIQKVFTKYSISVDITEKIRSTFRSKLWRMGKKLSQLGGTKCKELIEEWKTTVWSFKVDSKELGKQLMSRTRSLESSLQKEVCKRQKLEIEVQELRKASKEKENVISALQKANKKGRGSSSKSWNEFTPQHKRVKRKQFVSSVTTTLSLIDDNHFIPQSMEVVHTAVPSQEKKRSSILMKGLFLSLQLINKLVKRI